MPLSKHPYLIILVFTLTDMAGSVPVTGLVLFLIFMHLEGGGAVKCSCNAEPSKTESCCANQEWATQGQWTGAQCEFPSDPQGGFHDCCGGGGGTCA